MGDKLNLVARFFSIDRNTIHGAAVINPHPFPSIPWPHLENKTGVSRVLFSLVKLLFLIQELPRQTAFQLVVLL